MPGAAARVWQTLSRGTRRSTVCAQSVWPICRSTSKESRYPLGSIERSRFLAALTSKGFPTAKLTAAYFANLDRWLANQPRGDVPGVVVLGIGPGRCGSSTLTAAFAAADDACATHETIRSSTGNPRKNRRNSISSGCDVWPTISAWCSTRLTGGSTCSSASGEFPSAKVVALTRDNESCVQSFLNVKGRGAGIGQSLGAPGQWDLAVEPVGSRLSPISRSRRCRVRSRAGQSRARPSLCRRVSADHRAPGCGASSADPVLRTEQLSESDTSARLSAHVGTQVTIPEAGLNAGTVSDGESEHFRL